MDDSVGDGEMEQDGEVGEVCMCATLGVCKSMWWKRLSKDWMGMCDRWRM